MIWPVKEPEKLEDIKAILAAPTPEFAIRGISFWSLIARQFEVRAYETVQRTFNAMLTYEHALVQRTVETAVLFFVASIECLSVPNRPWRDKRVTKRFTEFLVALCEEKLSETINHSNFLEAFGVKKRLTPKGLADLLYKRRSVSVHAGKMGISIDFLGDANGRMAVALVAEVGEAAILNFIERPHSSLYGDPLYDSEIRVELSIANRTALEQMAHARNLSIAEVIRGALGFTG